MSSDQIEKSDDNKINLRNDILVRAREAKKTKRDNREVLIKEHTEELTNINTHISKIYSSINTIITMLPVSPGKRILETDGEDDAPVTKKIKSTKTDSGEEIQPLVITEPVNAATYIFSEMMGKAVGAILFGGGMFLIKGFLQPRVSKKVHERYESFN